MKNTTEFLREKGDEEEGKMVDLTEIEVHVTHDFECSKSI